MREKNHTFEQLKGDKLQRYWLIAYLIPIFLLFWFVVRFSVNVPYLDQWELIHFFDKVAAGNANFGDLFAQHNVRFAHRHLFRANRLFILLIFALLNIYCLKKYSSKFNYNRLLIKINIFHPLW
jgi:hypothetical protein